MVKVIWPDGDIGYFDLEQMCFIVRPAKEGDKYGIISFPLQAFTEASYWDFGEFTSRQAANNMLEEQIENGKSNDVMDFRPRNTH